MKIIFNIPIPDKYMSTKDRFLSGEREIFTALVNLSIPQQCIGEFNSLVGRNDFYAGTIYYEGHWKGWALKLIKLMKSRLFGWGALASLVALSGPKKVSISGPTPSSGPSNG
jgi:hypothetical protein